MATVTFASRADAVNDMRRRITAQCPAFRVGDVFAAVHGVSRAKVVKFYALEDDGIGPFPWPMVVFESQAGVPFEWGAPALIGVKRLRMGRGKRWAPPVLKKPVVPRAPSARERKSLSRVADAANARMRKAVAELEKGRKKRGRVV